MPAFERGGLAFNYLDEGYASGRPFVFQHGLGAGRSLVSSQFGRPRARELAPVLGSLAGDAPGWDRAQWREVRVPALVLASWQDPTHPYSYAEILARELPSAELAELTPKAEDEGRHVADARAAIAGFLGRVFPSAVAQGEAARQGTARR